MIHEPVLNRMPWAKEGPAQTSSLLSREWLVTNGLGGYAAGTIAGVATRRFHGLLIAALPAPLGRVMVLNHLAEELRLPSGRVARLGGDELEGGALDLPGAASLLEFRLESGLPVWRFQVDDTIVEKSLVLPHLQNTVFVRYRMLEGRGRLRLRMRPSVHFRPHEGRVDLSLDRPYIVAARGNRFSIRGEPDAPALRLIPYGEGASMVLDGGCFRQIQYSVEQSRGYDARGRLWSPGYLRAELEKGGQATLAASTEPWEVFSAMRPEDAFETEALRRSRLRRLADPRLASGPSAEWVLAADQFVATPNGRVVNAARTRAAGDDIRTIMAGYHWFTDWGRDTMISLEGLTLITGRWPEAGYILRMFAGHVKDGLIPNLFPEGRHTGLYHTADATLWFFHALDRYLEYSQDRPTLALLLPQLKQIIERHDAGTRFGIGADPKDGLLSQGEEGYQLTWMDAKVDDWVVTPRRGKAVEINALWHNALTLMARWIASLEGEAAGRPYAQRADRVRASFNERFWNESAGCLFDVLDGDPKESGLIRPNQVFAVSLPNPVLDRARWAPVMSVVERDLLTPFGLRSLSPRSPGYKPVYSGDLRARDAAYHQGTVWAWLIGPFIDAWLKLHPGEESQARRFLGGFVGHLGEACLGSVSEIFDAEAPFTPRGCVAQAWSVAEVLRAWLKTSSEEL